MITPNHRGFKKEYAYGGSGIFDSLASLFTSNVAKQIGSSALDVGKNIAKEGAKKALEAGKTAAVDAGTRLVKKALAPKSKKILQKYAALHATGDTNESIDGGAMLLSGAQTPKVSNDAIAIEKLIKKLSKGSGIKTT